MVALRPSRHAFSDGLSRRDIEDVTLGEHDPIVSESVEIPSTWTPEHVARRMVEAFETLLVLGGRVGPRQHANGWPTMLQEFSDLIDEDAMKHAREQFMRARKRPSSDEIARMDEALAWPLQHGGELALSCDALLIWSLCKAGGFSIAGMLRARVVKAKALAATMQDGENARREHKRKMSAIQTVAWARRKVDEESVASRGRGEQAEAARRIKHRAEIRHERATRDLQPIQVLPSDAMPEKVLSRSTLDRLLSRALAHFADRLQETSVPVR